MLILTRRINQSFMIIPHPDLDLATPIGELFKNGPIQVGVTRVTGFRVRLSVTADHGFLVLREELFQSR